MKNLKTIALTLFMSIASMTVLFTSCTTDPCRDIICDNGGVCDNGSCACPAGYEGLSCETRTKTNFTGNYTGNGQDDQGGSYSGWTISITDADTTNPTSINIAMLDDMNVQQLTFTGDIDANGNITLDNKSTTNFLYDLGTGTVVTGISADLTFRESDNPGGTNPFIYTFNNMLKQ